jgi:hypothetical protein
VVDVRLGKVTVDEDAFVIMPPVTIDHDAGVPPLHTNSVDQISLLTPVVPLYVTVIV